MELARPGDDAELCRLLRDNPMRGEISLTWECAPPLVRAAPLAGAHHQFVVAREPACGRIVAMGTRSVRQLYVDGRPCRIGYLGQLRVDEGWRKRLKLYARGYALLRSLRADDELSFDLTSIMEGNEPARRLLEAGLPGLPRYRPCARLVTVVAGLRVASRTPRNARVDIERGSPQLVGEIVDCLQRNLRRYQFAPYWSAADLCAPGPEPGDFHLAVRSGRVIGCAACWDQRPFRQLVVSDYGRRLGRWRMALNAAAALAGLPRLPAPGEALGVAFLSHLAVDDDDPGVLLRLIDAARGDARQRGAAAVILGFAADNPMLAAVRDRLPHRSFDSVLYAVDWGGPGAVDGAMVHVEVSIL